MTAARGLEARLDQHFFEERVSHLHGRAHLALSLVFGAAEGPRGEARRSVDAVAPCG